MFDKNIFINNITIDNYLSVESKNVFCFLRIVTYHFT
jgi:hypothetical protein